MSGIKLSAPKSSELTGTVQLNGSKSISNRVLLIQALAGADTPIENLSKAEDTATMLRLLKNSSAPILDAGDAGTAFRFMTAYLAMKPGKHFLTGSSRMRERPIAVLVEALNSLGANISYAAKKGYPPLNIDSPKWKNEIQELNIDASVSSQYISALLMIAPYLPNGLKLNLQQIAVSEPYIDMTVSLMQFFGADCQKSGNSIIVAPQKYSIKPYTVESDWSAASYFYAIAALSNANVKLNLRTLFKDGIQGDALIADIMKGFGINSQFNENGTLTITKSENWISKSFEYDFKDCPDLAQTVAVLCAALNIPTKLTGLQTLNIKETDRISALKTELEKLGAAVDTEYSAIHIRKGIDPNLTPTVINTYRDHRMAMAFAPLSLIYGTLKFDNREVVSKSYPTFWEDLQLLGFAVK